MNLSATRNCSSPAFGLRASISTGFVQYRLCPNDADPEAHRFFVNLQAKWALASRDQLRVAPNECTGRTDVHQLRILRTHPSVNCWHANALGPEYVHERYHCSSMWGGGRRAGGPPPAGGEGCATGIQGSRDRRTSPTRLERDRARTSRGSVCAAGCCRLRARRWRAGAW